jgi:hypothetical protein
MSARAGIAQKNKLCPVGHEAADWCGAVEKHNGEKCSSVACSGTQSSFAWSGGKKGRFLEAGFSLSHAAETLSINPVYRDFAESEEQVLYYRTVGRWIVSD